MKATLTFDELRQQVKEAIQDGEINHAWDLIFGAELPDAQLNELIRLVQSHIANRSS